MKDIRLFTSQPVAKFYDSLFLNLDLSFVPEFPKTGKKGFSNHALICAFIVMKCEGFYNGKKHRGCTKYITIPNDLSLSVDRDIKYFKSNYSLRSASVTIHVLKTQGRNECG